MYCRICGEHLYKNITFKNLFKMNYYTHEECEKLINKREDYITIPFLDKLLLFDYILEEEQEDADADFIYEKYSILLFERLLRSEEWSIVYFQDKPMDETSLVLVTKLAENALLICQVYHENLM